MRTKTLAFLARYASAKTTVAGCARNGGFRSLPTGVMKPRMDPRFAAKERKDRKRDSSRILVILALFCGQEISSPLALVKYVPFVVPKGPIPLSGRGSTDHYRLDGLAARFLEPAFG